MDVKAAAASLAGSRVGGWLRNRLGSAIGGTPGTDIATSRHGGVTAFSFGDAEGVLDRRELLSYAQVGVAGQWYEPPVPMASLARTYRMSPHHQSALLYKRNQLARHFVPSRWLDQRNFAAWVLDYLVMGNGYLERRDNLAGRPLQLVHSLAAYTRRGVNAGVYWWVPGWKQQTPFRDGAVFHLWEPDLAQEIYGLPEYLSAIQAGLLNEQATIFRRRYYLNGSHMGYILYINDPSFPEASSQAMQAALENSKGPGNFKNLFLHLPKGNDKSVQIIPVGEAAAKDEFFNMKNVTRDDVLAAHRVPPVLLGVVPQVTGGFGKPGEAADAFHFAEIEPLQSRLLEVNDWLGVPAVAFRDYERQAQSAGPPIV